MKVGLVSLGCAKNLVDSEMMLGLLKAENYQVTSVPESADLLIVNTCGFIESAKEEAITTILEMARLKKPHQKLVVTGCLVQRYIEELKPELPEVDRFITITDYPRFGKIIEEVMGSNISSPGLSYYKRLQSTVPYSAYVRIADGCNNRCSYCAIPLIRGNMVSRNIADIEKECKAWIAKGIKELVIIAQDTTKFGQDSGECIEDLLETILKLDGLYMLRLLYLYPDEISERLLHIFKDNPKLAPYFDIPIQHASNKILKAMNRRGTKEDIRNIINHLRELVPNVVIRTTVMVGFPGESEEDYQELEDFIKEIGFDRLGVFMYSPEEGTASFESDDQVDEDVKKDRYDRLMKVQMKIAYQKNKEKIGEISECFVDGYDTKMRKYRLRNYAFSGDDVDGYIYVDSLDKLTVGDIIKVRITGNYIYDLLGEICK